ncbi:hypothetical protein Ae505Ps2_5081c [Pseudonocardia sp. Ae505_Ps2]|nr:hypothetical protein Ae505Ps2_5081c [Pseudonocardia sp. Ae505_Ps2]
MRSHVLLSAGPAEPSMLRPGGPDGGVHAPGPVSPDE